MNTSSFETQMWWLIIIAFPILLLVLLLTSRLVLEIDSTRNLYSFRYGRIARGWLDVEHAEPELCMHVAWWHKEYQFSRLLQRKKPTEKKARAKKTKGKKATHRRTIKKFFAVLQSFVVERCVVVLDSGDVIMNAFLYSALAPLYARMHFPIMINFIGVNRISIRISNSLARMLWALIKS